MVTGDAVQHPDPSREYGLRVQRYLILLASVVFISFDFRRILRLPGLFAHVSHRRFTASCSNSSCGVKCGEDFNSTSGV
jgi:hypothetical protein